MEDNLSAGTGSEKVLPNPRFHSTQLTFFAILKQTYPCREKSHKFLKSNLYTHKCDKYDKIIKNKALNWCMKHKILSICSKNT